jgi:hypothetical protein
MLEEFGFVPSEWNLEIPNMALFQVLKQWGMILCMRFHLFVLKMGVGVQ